MKKIFAIALVIVSLTACHYGQEDAHKTLDANEQYKTEKAEYSTNRGNDGTVAETPVADSTVVADTTAAATTAKPAHTH